MSGYTGVARKGHALVDPGQGRLSLERVTLPCPECKRQARLEILTVNGEECGQIICPTWRPRRGKSNVPGCRPVRISKEELEKIMGAVSGVGEFITAQQEEELRNLIASVGLNPSSFALACGWIRSHVHDILNRKRRLTEEAWAHMGSVAAQKLIDVKERLEGCNASEGLEPSVEMTVRGQGLLDRLKEFRKDLDAFGAEADEFKRKLEAVEYNSRNHFERLNQIDRSIREATEFSATLSDMHVTKTEVLTVALAELKNTLTEHMNRVSDDRAARKATHSSVQEMFFRLEKLEKTAQENGARREEISKNQADQILELSALTGALNSRVSNIERSSGRYLVDYSRGVGEPLEWFQLEYEVEQAQQDPRNPDSTKDLLTSFYNFERICRKMRAKCPHLFQAAVRRASEGAF